VTFAWITSQLHTQEISGGNIFHTIIRQPEMAITKENIVNETDKIMNRVKEGSDFSDIEHFNAENNIIDSKNSCLC
jgi:cytidylate kinase